MKLAVWVGVVWGGGDDKVTALIWVEPRDLFNLGSNPSSLLAESSALLIRVKVRVRVTRSATI